MNSIHLTNEVYVRLLSRGGFCPYRILLGSHWRRWERRLGKHGIHIVQMLSDGGEFGLQMKG